MILNEGHILELLKQTDNKEYKKLIDIRKNNVEEYNIKLQFWIKEFEDEDTRPELDIITAPRDIGDNPILYQNTYHSTNILKRLSKNILEYKEELRFIINKNFVVEGKILPSKMEYKENIVLIRASKKNNLEMNGYDYRLFFIDGYAKNARINSGECYSYFYIYDLVTKEGLRYRVFSENKLGHEVFILEGTLFLLDDFPDVGYRTQTQVKMPLLFVHKDCIHPIISKYESHEDMFKAIKKYKLTKPKFWEYLFYHKNEDYTFLHPDYFMEIMSSFIFSTKYDGYPLHMIIISKAGAGKSTLEESLHTKLETYQDIVEGSGSTIKKLVPSFKSTTPSQGALMTSSRFAVIDEFLRILMRIRSEDRQIQLSMLNPLLEHKNRQFGSGNCTIQGSMTAKMLAVSNPVYGTNTMIGTCSSLDTSFLSRLFIWYIDDDHVKRIQNREFKKINKFKMNDGDLISIVDYLQSFKSKCNHNKIRVIVKNLSNVMIASNPDADISSILDIYNARYYHHALCLIDGIIKTRCLCECDSAFTATAEDYELLDKIWHIMIKGWNLNI